MDGNKRFKAMEKSLPSSISGLRLEAIFHPKFENERPDEDIRQRMLANVDARRGHLEASLKHSGSLILWSGRQCFYSKNSTGNTFTKTGEILLMQHFARCFGATGWREEYHRCSEFVRRRRLTCSFEVVTSILGHHGDLPSRDYIILIAVADRSHRPPGGAAGVGRFYSTCELVKFAHAHRLPHNDVWLFGSAKSCECLFRTYDSMRETGTATPVIQSLDQIVSGDTSACAKVSSLYPHDVFQGEILEGLVIRYISCNETESSASMDEMRHLSAQSVALLESVPPTLKIESSGGCHIQSADLRELATNDNFEEKLDSLLDCFHAQGRRRTHHEKNSTSDAVDDQPVDLVAIATKISAASDKSKYDSETRQIAQLVQTLSHLNINVSYKTIHETNSSGGERLLCIVHVHHDSAFAKYNKHLVDNPGMALYRGFSIELFPSDGGDECDMEIDCALAEGVGKDNQTQEKLMLKMKFLPYMVRTFVCRNGLSILQDSGSAAFENFAATQLSRWRMSNAAKKRWIPFFRGWAVYCTAPTSSDLPPLSSKTYLYHLNEFTKRYDNGEFRSVSKGPSFHGLVVLVGLVKSNMDTLAQAISKELKCTKIVHDINDVTDKDVLLSTHRTGGGLLCIAGIEEGTGSVRKLARDHEDAIHVITLDDDDRIILCGDDKQRLQKITGMATAWSKVKCKLSLELSRQAAEQNDLEATVEYLKSNDAAKAAIDKLKEFSGDTELDERPGLIVYFPSIPGTGKSSLCHELTSESLGMGGDRRLLVKEGDQIKGQFYKIVTKEVLNNPASVVIVDKNVPPASFSSVHNLSIGSRSFALPVIFGGMEDTSIGQHTYPFTLNHLAVCISRVLKRDAKSHKGKLDSGTKNACLIVVKFYCFYRNLTVERMMSKLRSIGCSQCEEVTIPFFTGQEHASEVPGDLRAALEDAVLLQTRRDMKSKEKCGLQDQIEIEARVRTSVKNNQHYIDSLTPALEDAKREFVTGVARAIATLPEEDSDDTQPSDVKSIKIASLDFALEDVTSAVQSLEANVPEIKEYFVQREAHRGNDENDKTLSRHIASLHCTYAHASEVSQSAMVSTFEHLIGKTHEAKMTAIVYNEDIAAIELQVAKSGTVPMPVNEFAHITLWCREGVESYQSNDLLSKLARGEAKRVEFDEPVDIAGTFSFWMW